MRRRATCFCFVPPQFPSFRTGCFSVVFSFICHLGRKASWRGVPYDSAMLTLYLLKLGVGSPILKYHFVQTHCSTKSIPMKRT
ncbi:hypothetical protein N7519_003492 [Penicillium mononematosum]|uniref:uncharacterized protein n=1 Tax=Penicillium mononematosum TaxID=268346 RepID=UPI00254789F6|nr:uncharacterized protein N7519_003492 [Penicillium mononematosum]KAJ6188584.1 hypothetical protein N7519_003492 [Penicillium mononematosum]